MADLQTNYFDVLNDHYGKPVYGTFVAKMRCFQPYQNLSEEALRAAAEEVIGGYLKPPPPAKLEGPLLRAKHNIDEPKAYVSTEIRPYDTKAQEQAEEREKRRAVAVIREHLDLAREADRDGWLRPLYDHVSRLGRMPDRFEVRRLQAAGHRLADYAKNNDGLALSTRKLHRRMQNCIGYEILGDEAIVRDEDDKPTVTGQQGYRAGTDHMVRRKAEASLEQIKNQPPELALSPTMRRKMGLPEPPDPEEDAWHTEE